MRFSGRGLSVATLRKSIRFRVGWYFNPYPSHCGSTFACYAILYPLHHQPLPLRFICHWMSLCAWPHD